MNPFELEGGPDADQEIGLGAEKGGEDGERDGIEGDDERGGEEEGDLSEDEGEPDGEKGTRFEVKGVEDVRDHET